METSKRDAVRGRLLGMMPRGAVAAEIGVWEGGFSRRILELCDPVCLHLIDPWQYLPEFRNTGFGRPKNADLMDSKYHDVVAAFGNDPRVRIHRMTSEQALSALPDASLDWVYIDGNHNEPFISRDLELCLAKVKPDGIIAGDDFNWQSDTLGAPVRRSVEAVMAQLGDCATLQLMANQYVIRLRRSIEVRGNLASHGVAA
ncbi:MAG: class I SAM-dependent methyltransferase [Paracoccaceae bacterium]|nr:MAG: class I SAM-dependent methyltransferase [Paracoccaceae bacterium]